jgi:hypothetical protein
MSSNTVQFTALVVARKQARQEERDVRQAAMTAANAEIAAKCASVQSVSVVVAEPAMVDAFWGEKATACLVVLNALAVDATWDDVYAVRTIVEAATRKL